MFSRSTASAMASASLLGWNSYLPPKEAFPKGKAAAKAALQLDLDLAEAHTPLAALLWLHDWQWDKAQTEFKRSLELGPTYATANHWYAEYAMTMGRHMGERLISTIVLSRQPWLRQTSDYSFPTKRVNPEI
jgi:hypothetical protein